MLATQVSGAQTVVPAGYFRHAPAPSHLPSVEHMAVPRSRQVPRGSLAPTATRVQRPRAVPDNAQLRHAPVHAVLQQTPSTQCWFWQSVSAVQDSPSTKVPQLLPVQAMPGAHMATVVHEVSQAPFSHR